MATIPTWCYGLAKSAIDLALLAGAFSLAFWTRFEGDVPEQMTSVFWWSLPLALCVKFAALLWYSVPRLAWRSNPRFLN